MIESLGTTLMMAPHVLHGFDVEPTATAATFVVEKSGKRLRLDLTPQTPFATLYGHAPIAGWVDARGSAAAPTWLSHPGQPYWWTYLPAERIFYVQFNQVVDAPNQTVEQFFTDAFAHAAQLPVDKFVLDLRNNDGGNNYLIKPIVVGLIRLPAVDRTGHLFVVTSRTTYSAAQNLVNRLELYTDPLFVGQPTGQHINSYGDPVPIVLPHSHLRFGMASVWWQDGDERDKRSETDPQIAADPTFADYVANRDPALEEIANYVPAASLQESIVGAVEAGGVARGLAAYEAYAADPLHRYTRGQMESALNRLGYGLLSDHRTKDAVAVLAVNARANPQSANAADSLGEAYAITGDRADAVVSYRRALALDPNLASSRTALARLEASPSP